MQHLGAGVCFLVVVGDGDAVELRLRIVAHEDAGRIFPSDGTSGFHLRPRQTGIATAQLPAFGDEVIDSTLSIFVAGIPVLNGGVFHLGVFVHDDFDDGGVELVFVAHRGSATFKVADIASVVAYDERTFKLSRVASVDAEVGGEFHGAAHAFGNIDKTSVGEDGGVEGSEEVVGRRHDGAEIFPNKFRILAHGFADGGEDDAFLLQFLFESGLHADGVHDGINRHAGELHAFFKRDAEFVKSLHQFRVNLLLSLVALLLRRVGVVGNRLIVYGREIHMSPRRRFERQPVTIGFEAKVQKPFRFSLFGGNEANDVLVQTFLNDFGVNVGREAVFIFLLGKKSRCFVVCHVFLKSKSTQPD